MCVYLLIFAIVRVWLKMVINFLPLQILQIQETSNLRDILFTHSHTHINDMEKSRKWLACNFLFFFLNYTKLKLYSTDFNQLLN